MAVATLSSTSTLLSRATLSTHARLPLPQVPRPRPSSRARGGRTCPPKLMRRLAVGDSRGRTSVVTCSAAASSSSPPSALPSALLFDCDGVLVDTEKDGHRISFNDTFQEVKFPHSLLSLPTSFLVLVRSLVVIALVLGTLVWNRMASAL